MHVRRALLGMTLLLIAASASAHHSGAMFDPARSQTLHGTVREFQWTNPHCFIELEVVADGKTMTWSIEMLSPGALYRKGWRPGSLRPGDRISIAINPLRDGGAGGGFVSAQDAAGVDLPRTVPAR